MVISYYYQFCKTHGPLKVFESSVLKHVSFLSLFPLAVTPPPHAAEQRPLNGGRMGARYNPLLPDHSDGYMSHARMQTTSIKFDN